MNAKSKYPNDVVIAKDVPGYEGLYMALSDGRIWSYASQMYLKYICQDCEAYNYTNDKEYLKSIERDASTVVSIAGVLLESDTE